MNVFRTFVENFIAFPSVVTEIPGVSEKSDEFKSCIFRGVLGLECRIGYQMKTCSKIFCLSGDPPHAVT